MNRRSPLVYTVLLLAWLGIIGWQAVEHSRVRAGARAALVNRARDITTTLGLVIRSQRRFGGMVSQQRLDPALKELLKTDDLKAVLLLNVAGDIVASAGEAVDFDFPPATGNGERWDAHRVTLVNLVDLETNAVPEASASSPIIILPRREGADATNAERGWPWRGFSRTNSAGSTGVVDRPRPPSPEPGDPTSARTEGSASRRRLGRPPWMEPAEYQSLLQKQGVHNFVVVLSTDSVAATTRRDLMIRGLIGVLGAAAVAGFVLAWRTLMRSSDLELRLVRASELNHHLRELNIAAAGLAHETKNPLNIIRGLAQLISKQADAPPEVRRKSKDITVEADRINAQLNQFINYSRPREVRPTRVSPEAIASDLARTLESDLEEKHIHLTVSSEAIWIDADEALMRQALFNLILNAIQAVDVGGEIQLVMERTGPDQAVLEVRDNGPGVPPDQRAEIFKPYFTTYPKGTGLGLAVVQQIVLAHGWEIQCLSREPRGAIFRLSHLKIRQTP